MKYVIPAEAGEVLVCGEIQTTTSFCLQAVRSLSISGPGGAYKKREKKWIRTKVVSSWRRTLHNLLPKRVIEEQKKILGESE